MSGVRAKFLSALLLINLLLSDRSAGSCLNYPQLLRMQQTSLSDIQGFLNREGWSFEGAFTNQTFRYFDYSLDYDVVKWSIGYGQSILLYNRSGKQNIVIFQTDQNCFNSLSAIAQKDGLGQTTVSDNLLSTVFKKGSVTVEFRNYINERSIQQYSILLYNSQAFESEIRVQRELEAKRLREEAAKQESIRRLMGKGDSLELAGNLEGAILAFNQVVELEPGNPDATARLERCNEKRCDRLVEEGNRLSAAGSYESAIRSYNLALECTDNPSLIRVMIKKTEEKERERRIRTALDNAKLSYSSGELLSTLQYIEEVLTLDPSNMEATRLKNETISLKNLLTKRASTVFSYAETNPREFADVKRKAGYKLDEISKNSSSGTIEFDLRILFDTSAQNKSSFSLGKNTAPSMDEWLGGFIRSSDLRPSMIAGYAVASRENLFVDLDWSTNETVFKYGPSGIECTAGNEPEEARSYILDNRGVYGKYTVSSKRKNLNGNIFNDVELVDYSLSGGPSSVFYSMILPGTGTLKVTHGKKGWGRMVLFLLSAGTSMYAKYDSDRYYDKYLAATNQADIDSYYDEANIRHQISLVTGGIAASIYLYDVIWVFSKGMSNAKNARSVKDRLENGPASIRIQPIVIK